MALAALATSFTAFFVSVFFGAYAVKQRRLLGAFIRQRLALVAPGGLLRLGLPHCRRQFGLRFGQLFSALAIRFKPLLVVCSEMIDILYLPRKFCNIFRRQQEFHVGQLTEFVELSDALLQTLALLLKLFGEAIAGPPLRPWPALEPPAALAPSRALPGQWRPGGG